MLEYKDILALAKATAKANKTAPVAYSFGGKDYSYEQMSTTLCEELSALHAEDPKKCYAVITEILTDTVPKQVSNFYGDFAEVKHVGQGEKIRFRRTVNNRTRAKQFVTRAGLAGVYEVFKLGGHESFDIKTSAMASAAQYGWEEYLDGRVDFSEMLNVIAEGMEQMIQEEIGAALIAGLSQLPAANKVSGPFDEVAFDKLLRIADSYGTGKAVIYCDSAFAAKLMPAEAIWYTEAMKAEKFDNGHFAAYKGHKIIILPNGMADASNTKLANDPSYCWIIPTGSNNDKPVKVVFEGAMQSRERENEDWSRDVQMYQKVGVAALLTNDICVFQDSELAEEFAGE